MYEESVKTIVVLDFEVNDNPSLQFNKCAITELCIFAFSSKCLNRNNDHLNRSHTKLPELPRLLHKLRLMVNPRRISSKTTGLTFDMLCNEAPFDKNSANCVLSFLERLEKPICLVAHNGFRHDFPILRYIFENVQMIFPPSTYFVDSFQAFIEICDKEWWLKKLPDIKVTQFMDKSDSHLNWQQNNETMDKSDALEENSHINWQQKNETTPSKKNNDEKRKFNSRSNDDTSPSCSSSSPPPSKRKCRISLNTRRELFREDYIPNYPQKNIFKLGNLYKDLLKQEPENLHQAEFDVLYLTQLILYFGLSFQAYIEERKQIFEKVPKLGSKECSEFPRKLFKS